MACWPFVDFSFLLFLVLFKIYFAGLVLKAATLTMVGVVELASMVVMHLSSNSTFGLGPFFASVAN